MIPLYAEVIHTRHRIIIRQIIVAFIHWIVTYILSAILVLLQFDKNSVLKLNQIISQ